MPAARLRRTEELRDLREPYGAELVKCWQAALDSFAQRHRNGRA